LAPKECGLRKGISADNTTHKLTNYILEAWSNKMHVGIFCDLAKALDCMNHDILLQKLQYCGAPADLRLV
jgi:hypothetical protein